MEAIDYLVKPIAPDRFQKAVNKAQSYHALLRADYEKNNLESISGDYFFIRADRKIFKVAFSDILFIEGLNNYVMLHIESMENRLITAMNIKSICEHLPASMYVRISKSFVVNIQHIDSFDNNTVFIGKHEIPIGNAYRNYFFEEFVGKKLLGNRLPKQTGN